ncbi:MAG: DNA polymerase III subunit chi [Halothiobacillaceae bacterium]
MTIATFHIVEHDTSEAPWLVVCQICEQWVDAPERTWVWCPDEGIADHLDDLLWGFREDVFVPHSLDPEEDAPITLGADAPPEGFQRLINLSGNVPADPQRFQEIAEVVAADETQRTAARARWKAYKQAGVTLKHQPVA